MPSSEITFAKDISYIFIFKLSQLKHKASKTMKEFKDIANDFTKKTS